MKAIGPGKLFSVTSMEMLLWCTNSNIMETTMSKLATIIATIVRVVFHAKHHVNQHCLLIVVHRQNQNHHHYHLPIIINNSNNNSHSQYNVDHDLNQDVHLNLLHSHALELRVLIAIPILDIKHCLLLKFKFITPLWAAVMTLALQANAFIIRTCSYDDLAHVHMLGRRCLILVRYVMMPWRMRAYLLEVGMMLVVDQSQNRKSIHHYHHDSIYNKDDQDLYHKEEDDLLLLLHDHNMTNIRRTQYIK